MQMHWPQLRSCWTWCGCFRLRLRRRGWASSNGCSPAHVHEPGFAAAAEVQDLCRDRDWGFCFIGGLAVLRWGEPRLTGDVDLTILAGFGAEGAIVDGLIDRFEARIDEARQFALRNRVALLDVEGIVIRQGEVLDSNLVRTELAPFGGPQGQLRRRGPSAGTDRRQAQVILSARRSVPVSRNLPSVSDVKITFLSR